jgi:hypothetical protein
MAQPALSSLKSSLEMMRTIAGSQPAMVYGIVSQPADYPNCLARFSIA